LYNYVLMYNNNKISVLINYWKLIYVIIIKIEQFINIGKYFKYLKYYFYEITQFVKYLITIYSKLLKSFNLFFIIKNNDFTFVTLIYLKIK